MTWPPPIALVPDRITVELDRTDVAVLVVALADIRDEDGVSAWQHPNVRRLRDKLSEAIHAQMPR